MRLVWFVVFAGCTDPTTPLKSVATATAQDGVGTYPAGCPGFFPNQSPSYVSPDQAEPYEIQFFPWKTGQHFLKYVGALIDDPPAGEALDHVGSLVYYWAENADSTWHRFREEEVTYNWQYSEVLESGSADVRFRIVFIPSGPASLEWEFCTD